MDSFSIKPLEWEYVERQRMTYTAYWSDGDVAYYIDQGFGSDSYYFRTVRWPEETIYDGDDLPSAQAAAQADYEARIRSALLSTPKPEADPVAYLTTRGTDQRLVLAKFVSDEERDVGSNGWTAIPLYAHPKPEATEGGAHEKGFQMLVDAYIRGATWYRQNEDFGGLLHKAALDYADYVTSPATNAKPEQTNGREGE